MAASGAPSPVADDPEALMLQAQSMRIRVEAQLRHGPASSGTLAMVLGESIALTNRYLQRMAEHGFIEEVTDLSVSRERRWRLAVAGPQFLPAISRNPETRALVDEISRLNFAADIDDLMRSHIEQEKNGTRTHQLPYSRGVIYVTATELDEFFDEYIELLCRYGGSAEDAPPGARAVLTRFMAFPAPAPPVDGPADDAAPAGERTRRLSRVPRA